MRVCVCACVRVCVCACVCVYTLLSARRSLYSHWSAIAKVMKTRGKTQIIEKYYDQIAQKRPGWTTLQDETLVRGGGGGGGEIEMHYVYQN